MEGVVMGQAKDILMITQEEIHRYQVVRKIFDKDINQQEAAEYLDLSDRKRPAGRGVKSLLDFLLAC